MKRGQDKEARERARVKGEKLYKSVRPCPKGHVGLRRLYNFSCEQCNNERRKKRKARGLSQAAAKRRYLKRYMEQPQYYVFDRARGRARRKGVPFEITVEDVEEIWPYENTCPVLELELIPNVGGRIPADNSPSLDRIDPDKGYVRGNIAILSHRANVLKNIATDPAELRKLADWLERIASKPSSK